MTRVSNSVSCLAVVATLLTGQMAAAQTAADRVHSLRRLGTAARMTPPVRDVAALRTTFARPATQRDVTTVLQIAGLSHLEAQVKKAIADGAVREVSMAPGSNLQWMGLRRGGTRADILRLVRWDGPKPFAGFEFVVDDGKETFTFVVPQDCGNLSLVSREPVRAAVAVAAAASAATSTAAGAGPTAAAASAAPAAAPASRRDRAGARLAAAGRGRAVIVGSVRRGLWRQAAPAVRRRRPGRTRHGIPARLLRPAGRRQGRHREGAGRPLGRRAGGRVRLQHRRVGSQQPLRRRRAQLPIRQRRLHRHRRRAVGHHSQRLLHADRPGAVRLPAVERDRSPARCSSSPKAACSSTGSRTSTATISSGAACASCSIERDAWAARPARDRT